jgi:hypothetical protein
VKSHLTPFEEIFVRVRSSAGSQEFDITYFAEGLDYSDWDEISSPAAIAWTTPCDKGSSDTLQSVRRWLKDCDENHKCILNKDPQLPKRVLEVGNNQVPIHHGQSRTGCYACLSHRWGEGQVSPLAERCGDVVVMK